MQQSQDLQHPQVSDQLPIKMHDQRSSLPHSSQSSSHRSPKESLERDQDMPRPQHLDILQLQEQLKHHHTQPLWQQNVRQQAQEAQRSLRDSQRLPFQTAAGPPDETERLDCGLPATWRAGSQSSGGEGRQDPSPTAPAEQPEACRTPQQPPGRRTFGIGQAPPMEITGQGFRQQAQQKQAGQQQLDQPGQQLSSSNRAQQPNTGKPQSEAQHAAEHPSGNAAGDWAQQMLKLSTQQGADWPAVGQQPSRQPSQQTSPSSSLLQEANGDSQQLNRQQSKQALRMLGQQVGGSNLQSLQSSDAAGFHVGQQLSQQHLHRASSLQTIRQPSGSGAMHHAQQHSLTPPQSQPVSPAQQPRDQTSLRQEGSGQQLVRGPGAQAQWNRPGTEQELLQALHARQAAAHEQPGSPAQSIQAHHHLPKVSGKEAQQQQQQATSNNQLMSHLGRSNPSTLQEQSRQLRQMQTQLMQRQASQQLQPSSLEPTPAHDGTKVSSFLAECPTITYFPAVCKQQSTICLLTRMAALHVHVCYCVGMHRLSADTSCVHTPSHQELMQSSWLPALPCKHQCKCRKVQDQKKGGLCMFIAATYTHSAAAVVMSKSCFEHVPTAS